MSEKPNKIISRPGGILAVCISKNKHTPKKPVESAELRPDWGVVGDAHAAPGKRQVSLLAIESIRKMQDKGLRVDAGDFAENITTEGINLVELPIGQELRIGQSVVLRISQIGKECHSRCAVYYKAGDCVMPREGVFAEVIQGGQIKKGDEIEIL